MRRLTVPMLCAFMVLTLGAMARANIVSLSCTGTGSCDDVTWQALSWSPTGSSNSWVSAGIQFTGTQSMLGTMTTTITTDSATDPTLSYTDTATNDSGAPVYSYNIAVAVATSSALSSDPTFSGATVITGPPGWSAIPSSGTLDYVGTSSGGPFAPPSGWAEYEAFFTMSGSSPVANGGSAVYSYTLNFEGNTAYDLIQVVSPNYTQPVPEPGTMALLAAGGGVILWRLRRRRRR